MDKAILIWLKNGDCFVTNKGSFDYTNYGVTAIGYFESDRTSTDNEDKVKTKDVIIPWINIAYVEKLVS